MTVERARAQDHGVATPEDRPEASAPGATPEQREEARTHYALGVRAYQDGDLKLALIEFERAYAIAPSFRMLYNLGQVHQQLGHYHAACDALERYLAAGADHIPEPRRAEVERDIKVLRDRTATLRVTSNEANAEVVLDDKRVGLTPLAPLAVDAGEHRLVVRKQGFPTYTELVTLAGGDTITSEAMLKQEGSRVRSVAAPVEEPRTWTKVAWGSTGVLAVSAVVFGVLAATSASELDDLRSTVGSTEGEREGVKSRAQTFAAVGDVLTVASVVAGASALYLTLRARPARPRVTARGPELHVSGAGLAGSF
jgi:hypothetical protein